MSKNQSQTLSVWYLKNPIRPIRIGVVSLMNNQKQAFFQYSADWLNYQDSFSLSPELQIEKTLANALKLYLPEAQNGLPHTISDSMPDRWGKLSIQYLNKPPRLTDFDYLYYAGDRRFGALGFSLDLNEYVPSKKTPLPTLDSLDELSELIVRLSQRDNLTVQEQLLMGSGTSLGGARPKLLIDIENDEWIAKLPIGDNIDMPSVENASMKLAKLAGINVSETILHQSAHGNTLLIKRFDRRQAERIHCLSARTFLPDVDTGYPGFADFIRLQCGVENLKYRKELFQRMIFNIMIGNTDDHEKNHALLYENNTWHLAPAYDIVPQSNGFGEQALRVGREGTGGNFKNAISYSQYFGLEKEEAIDCWRAVALIVDGWKDFFVSEKVSAKDIQELSDVIDKPEQLENRTIANHSIVSLKKKNKLT